MPASQRLWTCTAPVPGRDGSLRRQSNEAAGMSDAADDAARMWPDDDETEQDEE